MTLVPSTCYPGWDRHAAWEFYAGVSVSPRLPGHPVTELVATCGRHSTRSATVVQVPRATASPDQLVDGTEAALHFAQAAGAEFQKLAERSPRAARFVIERPLPGEPASSGRCLSPTRGQRWSSRRCRSGQLFASSDPPSARRSGTTVTGAPNLRTTVAWVLSRTGGTDSAIRH